MCSAGPSMKPTAAIIVQSIGIFPPLRRWLTLLALVIVVPVFADGGQRTIRVDTIPFQVEIARTAAERQRGLMFREYLGDDEGMLFIQPKTDLAAFWMKNTYIPLDLLYFDGDGHLVEIFSEVPPCTTPQCPVYTSHTLIKYILEINAGRAQRLGLKPGALLHLD